MVRSQYTCGTTWAPSRLTKLNHVSQKFQANTLCGHEFLHAKLYTPLVCKADREMA